MSPGRYGGRFREAGRLLSERRFRRWFIARWVSVTGSTISPVALAWAIIHMGGGATGIGIVLLGGPVVFMALSPIAGVVADRIPRVPILVACQIASGAFQALSAALILTGTATVAALAVLELLAGASGAFFTPASLSVLPSLVARDDLTTANSLRQIANNTVMIIGPSVAGVVIVAFGPGWVLAWDAVTFFVSAALLATVHVSPAASARPPRRFLEDLTGGWAAFSSRRWVWVLALVSATTNMTWVAAINVVGPVYAKASLGGPVGWGIVQSAIGLGFIAGSAVSLLTRLNRVGLLVIGGFLPDVAFLAAMAAGAPLSIVAVTAAATGATGTMQMIAYQSHLQAAIPDDELSRVLSTIGMIGTIGVPVAYAISGPATAAVGVHAVQWACAAIVTAAAAAGLSVSEVRGLRTAPAPEPVLAEIP